MRLLWKSLRLIEYSYSFEGDEIILFDEIIPGK